MTNQTIKKPELIIERLERTFSPEDVTKLITAAGKVLSEDNATHQAVLIGSNGNTGKTFIEDELLKPLFDDYATTDENDNKALYLTTQHKALFLHVDELTSSVSDFIKQVTNQEEVEIKQKDGSTRRLKPKAQLFIINSGTIEKLPEHMSELNIDNLKGKKESAAVKWNEEYPLDDLKSELSILKEYAVQLYKSEE